MGNGTKNHFLCLLSFMHLFLVSIHAMKASGVCGIIAWNLCVCPCTVVWDEQGALPRCAFHPGYPSCDIANLIFFPALPSPGTGPADGAGKGMGDFLKGAAAAVPKLK